MAMWSCFYLNMTMKCCSNNNFVWFRRFYAAFSLPETAAALVILAIVCTGIVIVFDNSIISAANSALRMQAFEVAQENMEKLLASSSVKESVEYGFSESAAGGPPVEWQSTVETFFEPITNRLWARAVCSADYIDSDGRQQKVELTNWITDLTQQQVLELIKRRQQQKEQLAQADRLLETIDDAAEYAGVDVNTIQQWVDNGMPVTEDGAFIKDYLDLYKQTGGKPLPADKAKLDDKFISLIPSQSTQPTKEPQTQKPQDQQPKTPEQQPESTLCGKTISELDKMSFSDLWDFLQNCPEFLQ
jgi:type II secretory pathway pseudopilin PulG